MIFVQNTTLVPFPAEWKRLLSADVACLMQQLHQKNLQCFLSNLLYIIVHRINLTHWVTHGTENLHCYRQVINHDRGFQCIIDWAKQQLRMKFENSGHFLIIKILSFSSEHTGKMPWHSCWQKRLDELCLHVSNMLSFAKLKKGPDHWRKKEYSKRTACFQPALQNQWDQLSIYFYKIKSSQPVNLKWQPMYSHLHFS